MRTISKSLLLLALAPVFVACRQLAHSTPPTRHAAETSTDTATQPVTENRDKHGAKDVQKYIAALQSPERVADLQVDVVLQKLALPADATVGDLGCGPGVFALAFAKASARGVVYASDIEPGQLDQVRQKIVRNDLHNIVPVLASKDDPHFPPARLDLVFIGDTYHHLDDRVAYMRRLQGALRPGGRLAILEYKPGTLPVGPPAEHKLAEGVMHRELAEAGYSLVEHFDTHPYHDFEIWRVLQTWEKSR